MNKIPNLILCFLFFTSSLVIAEPVTQLSVELINSVNDNISNATNNCDLEGSTKYYFDGTQFFDYSIVNEKKHVNQQNLSQAIELLRETMEACFITLAKEETIFEDINITDTGEKATFTFEAIYYLKTKDGRYFKSHGEGKMLFIIIDEEVKISEVHNAYLSLDEIKSLE